VRLLAEGHSMKQAAAVLGISTRTVAYHKYQAMEALAVRSSAQLVRFAVESRRESERASSAYIEATVVKKLRGIQRSVDRHWWGNGFPVRTLFAYPNEGELLSPFLLLDYAGPTEFSPTTERRASELTRTAGSRPSRSCMPARSSTATPRGGGRIGEGDVQWMTAASGIVHEEFHGRDYAKRGGPFEMVQLWVNLPRKDKMGASRLPGDHGRPDPSVPLPGGSRHARVIAGGARRRQRPCPHLHAACTSSISSYTAPSGRRSPCRTAGPRPSLCCAARCG
jgi:hypothetical protein